MIHRHLGLDLASGKRAATFVSGDEMARHNPGFDMKNIVIFILLCVIAYMMLSEDSTQTTSPASIPEKQIPDAKREEIKLHFKSISEKLTKDATWTSKDNFKVGVVDDGSNRDEYARYVCQILHKHGFKGAGVRVQVIDIQKRGGVKDWIVLGEARCD